MADNQMIGLVFSRLLDGGAQNVVYIISNEEITLFLNDVADGRYDGKPWIGIEMQDLQNPALRDYLKLPASTRGAVVTRCMVPAADTPLRPCVGCDHAHR